MADDKEEQIEVAERLQLKVLKLLEQRVDDGTITSTDMATLVRLLSANGWSLDPASIPQSLQKKLGNIMRYDEGLEDERKLRVI